MIQKRRIILFVSNANMQSVVCATQISDTYDSLRARGR